PRRDPHGRSARALLADRSLYVSDDGIDVDQHALSAESGARLYGDRRVRDEAAALVKGPFHKADFNVSHRLGREGRASE
ncbi:MAG: hypothetical protein ACR2NB_12285, partial [Solirubrobacteraceae bacterium]